jgi:hypothetical protein
LNVSGHFGLRISRLEIFQESLNLLLRNSPYPPFPYLKRGLLSAKISG